MTTDDDARRAIALAMIEARLEAAAKGDPEGAQQEIDLLAEIADSDDPAAILEGAMGDDADGAGGA